MLSKISNHVTIVISLLAIVGMLVHDTQVDNAIVATRSNVNVRMGLDETAVRLRPVEQHTHTLNELSSDFLNIKISQSNSQNKNDNEKKYISQRRLLGNNVGSEYLWPSI